MGSLDIHRALFAHSDWARDKLMRIAKDLSDEALDRALEMGLGSLRATLHHLWAVERVWLDRWLEKPAPALADPERSLAVTELRERSCRTADERNRLLDQFDAEGLGRRITYTNAKGEDWTYALGDMVLHVCNHGMHHRAQALNMLRHTGVKTPGLDYLFMRVDPSPSPPPVPQFDLDLIRRYYAYSDWAQERVHASAATLTDEQLDRPFDIGLGSLRATLLHIRDGEQSWLESWTGPPSKEYDQQPPTTSIAELRHLFQQTAQRRNAFLDGSDAATLQNPVSVWVTPEKKLSFALGETVLQLHSHGTHHRAQAVNMLRRLGAEMPALDFLVWRDETAGTADDH